MHSLCGWTTFSGFNTLSCIVLCCVRAACRTLASLRIKAFMYITALRVGTQPFPFQIPSYKLSVSKHTLELKLIAKLINSTFFLYSLLISAPSASWMAMNVMKESFRTHLSWLAHGPVANMAFANASNNDIQASIRAARPSWPCYNCVSLRVGETNEYIHHPSPANSNKFPFTRWKITVCEAACVHCVICAAWKQTNTTMSCDDPMEIRSPKRWATAVDLLPLLCRRGGIQLGKLPPPDEMSY